MAGPEDQPPHRNPSFSAHIPQHGTYGYVTGCRCKVCVTAKRKSDRKRDARRRERNRRVEIGR